MVNGADEADFNLGFKASETLLGIETGSIGLFVVMGQSFKASETLLGIETAFRHQVRLPWTWLQSL